MPNFYPLHLLANLFEIFLGVNGNIFVRISTSVQVVQDSELEKTVITLDQRADLTEVQDHFTHSRNCIKHLSSPMIQRISFNTNIEHVDDVARTLFTFDKKPEHCEVTDKFNMNSNQKMLASPKIGKIHFHHQISSDDEVQQNKFSLQHEDEPRFTVFTVDNFQKTNNNLKPLSSPQICRINFRTQSEGLDQLSQKTLPSIQTQEEPQFPVPLFKEDTMNYGSKEVCRRQSEIGDDDSKCDIMLSESCQNENDLLFTVDFSLQPPQLELLPVEKKEVNTDNCVKVPRGGDLFDDVRKYRWSMSWKLIK